MQTILKIALSLLVILAASAVARRYPSAAGLISVMPLTGALVLVWVYLENNGDPAIMQQLTRGALWGIVPSIIFFLMACFGFSRNMPLHLVLLLSFGAWGLAAFFHQLILR